MARLFSPLIPAKSYLGKRLWILANKEPERFVELVTPFTMADKKVLFNENIYKKIKDNLSRSLAKKLIHFGGKGDFVKKMLYSDFKHYLADDILVKVDRTTMLASLESRAPFLDHRLVELVFSFPSQWKTGEQDTKKILRDMLRDSLPTSVLGRKKMGFGVPLKKWFTDALIDVYHHTLLSPETDLFFSRKTVLRYLKEHKHKNVDRTHEIWLILVFLLWAQANRMMS
jgi:asparagine synthase (glutamine-hydrolysing)